MYVFNDGGSAASAGASAGSSSGKRFVRKQFERIADMLKWLAGKAAAVLPGILASIIKFFLRSPANVKYFIVQILNIAVAVVVSSHDVHSKSA